MWQLPTPAPTIAPGEIHLWQGRGAPTHLALDDYHTRLTAWELARAARFATPTLQRRYLQAHTLLHTLLAAYTQSATRCELATAANGKPFLRAPQLVPALEFNMSHSNEVVAIAVALGHGVGVDVEQVRPLDDLALMIARVCTQDEQAYLDTLDNDERLAIFYQLWTRKEAWLKLRGDGLVGGLASVTVHPLPAAVTIVDFTVDVSVGHDFAGAVALPQDVASHLTPFKAVWQNA